MLRTALLNGNNINQDKDFSKYIENAVTPGIISGFNILNGYIKPGKARVLVTRTGDDAFYCYVENTTDISVDITGTKKIWVEVKQSSIDNGLLNNENGSDIAQIRTGSAYPTTNFIKVASVDLGIVTDNREFSKPKINIDDLANVVITGKTSGQTFIWNGTKRVNMTPTVDIASLPLQNLLDDTFQILVEKNGTNYRSRAVAGDDKYGLSVRALDSEVAEGTNAYKFVTPYQLKTYYGINVAPATGNVLLYGDASESGYTATTRIKIKEMRVKVGGTYSVKHDSRIANGTNADTKVCVNGVTIGDVFRTTGTSTFQRDVTVNAGDYIQVYGLVYPSGNGYVSNFNIGRLKNESFSY